ncbi:MAG: trypsin-like peptidase domain-containing protein [Spirochaetota bacterium]
MKLSDSRNLGRGVYLMIAVSLLTVFALSCRVTSANPLFNEDPSPLKGSSKVADALETQNAFNEIFDLYRDRVVFISTEQTVQVPQNPFYNDPFFRDFFGEQMPRGGGERTRTGLGSGFILSNDGYICTNHHVVANVDKVEVKIGEETFDAKIIGSDARTDLALLKIESDAKLSPVFLGNSDEVKVGDWAIAIGNPFGLDKTFTTGVISAVARKDLDLMGGSQTHIQTDASINPGNSGGPLININGEVIGINRMIYSRSGGNMGIGFAIPVNRAKDILLQLKEHGTIKRGYIGVQIVPLTEGYANRVGLDDAEGALVGGIMENSPAEEAGVKVGDIIIEANGAEVKNFGDLVSQIDKTKIGERMKLIVWREERKVSLFLTIKERP